MRENYPNDEGSGLAFSLTTRCTHNSTDTGKVQSKIVPNFLMDDPLASAATAISSPTEIGKLSPNSPNSPNSLGDIDSTSCIYFQAVEKSSLLQGIDCVKFKQSLVV